MRMNMDIYSTIINYIEYKCAFVILGSDLHRLKCTNGLALGDTFLPEEWSEQEMGRDMWPSFAGMLELGALNRICTLQRIHKEMWRKGHPKHVYFPVGMIIQFPLM